MSITYGGDYITDTDGGKLRPSSSVMRNRIINGAMVIDQRNAGASVTANTNDVYVLDRWQLGLSQSGKYSVQQNAGSVTPPVGFANYLGVTSLSAYSIGSGDFFSIRQKIEGFNTADLAWGTANAQPITFSFFVRSSLTGTFGGVFHNSAQNRNYPFTYTINAANTWEQKSITVAGDTTGTWLTNNGTGIGIQFGLGVGSAYTQTAGAWTSSFAISATGATSVVGTSGATFYITGVQLEVGSSATGFEYRQYQQELALCQRYYVVLDAWHEYAQGGTGNINQVPVVYPVPMRATPTATALSSTGSGNTVTSYTFHSRNGVNYQYNLVYNSSTTGYGYRQETDALNAEL